MAICQQSRPGQILGARSLIIRPSNVGINCLRSRLRIKKTRACPEHQDSRPSVFQISSQGMGLKWAQENVYEILAEAAIIRKTTRLPIPRAYLNYYDEAFPDEAAGFRSRQIFESDLALTERILENRRRNGRPIVGRTRRDTENNRLT